MTTAFETEPCSRCGGSGRHSYNQIHGDRCYGCHGTGKRLTKRGRVAREMLYKYQSRRVDMIKVGNFILHSAGIYTPKKWCRVDAIAPDALNPGYLKLTIGDSGLLIGKGAYIRVAESKAAITADVQAAVDYQNTLTKAGKPAKRNTTRSKA